MSGIPTVSKLVGEKPVAVALSIDDPTLSNEIKEVITNAESRWLKNDEVLSILERFQIQGVTWPKEPAEKPAGGKLFVFSRGSCRGFRSDKHNWRKKQDGRTVKETHEKLKVGDKERLNCYYAHAEGTDGLQRRCYWILETTKDDVVLVHYRCTTSSRAGQRTSPYNNTATAVASGPSTSRPRRAAAQRARLGTRYTTYDSEEEDEEEDFTDDKDSDYHVTEDNSDSYRLDGGGLSSFFPSLSTAHHQQQQIHVQQQVHHQQQQFYATTTTTTMNTPGSINRGPLPRDQSVMRDDSFGLNPYLAGVKPESGLPSLAQQFKEAQEKRHHGEHQQGQPQQQQQQYATTTNATTTANNMTANNNNNNSNKSPRKLVGDPFGSGNFLPTQMSLGIEGGGLSGILQSADASLIFQALNNDQLDASTMLPPPSPLFKPPPQQGNTTTAANNTTTAPDLAQRSSAETITDEQILSAIQKNDTNFFYGLSIQQLSGRFSDKVDQELQEFLKKSNSAYFKNIKTELQQQQQKQQQQRPITVPVPQQINVTKQQQRASNTTTRSSTRKPTVTITSGSVPGIPSIAGQSTRPSNTQPTTATATAGVHHEAKQVKVETLRRIRNPFKSDSGGSSMASIADISSLSLPLSQRGAASGSAGSAGDGGATAATKADASHPPTSHHHHHHQPKQRKNPTAAPSPPSQQDRLAAAAAQTTATVAARRDERLQQARQVRHADAAITTRESEESQDMMITPLSPNGLLRFTSHVVNLMPQIGSMADADDAAQLMKDMSIDVKTKEGGTPRSQRGGGFGSSQEIQGSVDREQSLNSLLKVVEALSGDLDDEKGNKF